MSKGDFSHRVVMPVSMVLITMLLSRMVYFNSSATVATLSGLVMFLSIAFGSFLIYPMTFFRGASIPERVIGCLVSPMVWNGIEMYNVGEAFTVSESLFYGLNIIFLATVASQFLIMGICDVFCRLLERRHTGEVRKAVGLFSGSFSYATPDRFSARL
jgi:hypothetical protein